MTVYGESVDRPHTLRGFQLTDLLAMYALDQVCFAPEFQFSLTAMRKFATARHAIVRLAIEERAEGTPGDLLGFAVVRMKREQGIRMGYVVTLDVAPNARGRGLGRDLLCAVEAAAVEQGGRAMELHVFEENATALRLYHALGYRLTHPAPNFYGAGLHGLVYRKELGSANASQER